MRCAFDEWDYAAYWGNKYSGHGSLQQQGRVATDAIATKYNPIQLIALRNRPSNDNLNIAFIGKKLLSALAIASIVIQEYRNGIGVHQIAPKVVEIVEVASASVTVDEQHILGAGRWKIYNRDMRGFVIRQKHQPIPRKCVCLFFTWQHHQAQD